MIRKVQHIIRARGSNPKCLGMKKSKRLLILASKLGYQTRSFAEAAEKLGVEVVFGTDRCHKLNDPWSDGALPLHFQNPSESAQEIAPRVPRQTVNAILALGDRPLRPRHSPHRLLASPAILRKRWSVPQ